MKGRKRDGTVNKRKREGTVNMSSEEGEENRSSGIELCGCAFVLRALE